VGRLTSGDVKELDVESVARATRVGWLVVAVLACAFSYSLGFQLGYSDGTTKADDRYSRVNDAIRSVIEAHEQADAGATTAGRLPSQGAHASTF
jgi:hypothetical protein